MDEIPKGPSRLLDGAVAKIAGWNIDRIADIKERQDGFYVGVDDDVPPYSSSITAAWTLVERLGPSYGGFEIAWVSTNEWRAAFTGCRAATAETAPMAICIAVARAARPKP